MTLVVSILLQTSALLGLPLTTTRIFLNHFNWNEDKLFDAYYDGDQDKLYRDANVVDPESVLAISSPNDIEECGICYVTNGPEVFFKTIM